MGVEIASAIPLSKVKFACRRSFHLTFRKLASNFSYFPWDGSPCAILGPS